MDDNEFAIQPERARALPWPRLDVRRAAAFEASDRRIEGAPWRDLDMTPQSAGLYALSLGLSHCFSDDHEMLRHGMVLCDARYAWCKSCQEESHAWPPRMTA
jgi:hypothetical protein